jgi:hypothetical protein
MREKAGRVLKGSDVKLEGQFTLDIAQTQKMGLPKRASAAMVEPKVRIVESQPAFAVLEITCSCGTAISLRCEYAGAGAPGGA